ncbi:MAG TPA: type VI secretion system tip protein TssI/VgrG [Polyangium sp.]|nr:type VI secretion system tip protein TssI/VgrG [Polyangium sp.]
MSTLELTLTGGETLSVHDFSVSEGISQIFTVSLIVRGKKPAVALQSIVGQPASFSLVAGWTFVKNMGARSWKGMVSYIEQVQAQTAEAGLSTYTLHIVPEFWKLTQRINHRIFQHKSIPDIIDVLLGEWGLAPTWEIDRAAYPLLEIRMQYGETDFDFVSRLLEEAGITYSFPERGGTGSVLLLSDKLHVGTPRTPIPYVDNPNQASQKEFLTHVRLGHEVRPGSHVLRDYDFRKPAFVLSGQAPPAAAPENRYEQYQYVPGGFLKEGCPGGGTPIADDKGVARHDQKFGTDRATIGLQSIRADKKHVAFETNTVDLFPGAIFTTENHLHPDLAESVQLLVTSFSLSGTPDDEWAMSGTAVFVNVSVPYRSPMKTAKPRIYGVQSATVVGPPGQEIYVDEYGRIRVQFPWDREGKFDSNSSCWMRVSHGWAGTGYGMITHPRVGHEVLVTFLDGDPDRPIVTGRVYNELQKVPYTLPTDMTVSTWKSQSSPATGGFNEIKFEDKAGMELVYTQAERDLNKLVKRDEVERTQRNKLSTVDGTEDNVVKGVRKTLLESSDHLHVKMDQNVGVDGSMSLTVKVNHHEKVGMAHAVDAGKEIHLKAGMTMVLEAGMRLTIKGPGGFIDIHPGGIDIVGMLVNINSGGSAGSGSGASPTAPTDALEANPKDTPS